MVAGSSRINEAWLMGPQCNGALDAFCQSMRLDRLDPLEEPAEPHQTLGPWSVT